MKHPMLLMRMMIEQEDEFWATHRKGGPRWGSWAFCWRKKKKREGLKETKTGPQFTKVAKALPQP